jgi:hypothetical protein
MNDYPTIRGFIPNHQFPLSIFKIPSDFLLVERDGGNFPDNEVKYADIEHKVPIYKEKGFISSIFITQFLIN